LLSAKRVLLFRDCRHRGQPPRSRDWQVRQASQVREPASAWRAFHPAIREHNHAGHPTVAWNNSAGRRGLQADGQPDTASSSCDRIAGDQEHGNAFGRRHQPVLILAGVATLNVIAVPGLIGGSDPAIAASTLLRRMAGSDPRIKPGDGHDDEATSSRHVAPQ
jgi:hypothetical protein